MAAKIDPEAFAAPDDVPSPDPAWLREREEAERAETATRRRPYELSIEITPGPEPREAPSTDERPAPELATVVTVVREWFTEAPPLRTWLLRDSRMTHDRGVLPLGKAGQLIAEGGAGKTMVFVDLAIAVASGGAWLQTFTVATPGRVLLVLGEEDTEEARRRVYSAGQGTDPDKVPAGSIVILPLAGKPCSMLAKDDFGNPQETPFLDYLREYIATAGPFVLIAIDPLSRFGGPDVEIDNATATRFVQACESLCAIGGATVLVAHHTNKLARVMGAVTGASGRGSTALFDGFRWQTALSVDDAEGAIPGDESTEVVTLTFTKSNYSRKARPLLLRRTDGGRLVPLDGDQEAAVTRAKSGAARREAKSAEKDAERERREARQADQRAAREAEKARAKLGERQAQDQALVAILAAHPTGILAKPLRAAMAARLGGCSDPALAETIARLGDAVRIDPAPKNGSLHVLVRDKLPPFLRGEGSAT